MEKKLCGAKTRSGEPCKKAGLQNGRCRLHGGKSTGPKDPAKLKGNTNALKHGLYETIWLDTLKDEERELFAQVATDPTAQIENEFRLCDIRIRRMMQRIRKEEQKDKPDIRRINALEEAITMVQLNKTNLIRENSRLLELNETESDGALDKLAEIIQQARQKHGS